jgi:adenylyltransferase/sulfurtransferase
MPATRLPLAGRAEKISLLPQEVARYSRHLIMPEVATEGQKRFKTASVLLIGGGLGSLLWARCSP